MILSESECPEVVSRIRWDFVEIGRIQSLWMVLGLKKKRGMTSRRDSVNKIPEVGASLGWVRVERCELNKAEATG